MAISKENAQKLRWLFADGHEVEFIETFIKIADKQGKVVPFILTDEQKDLVHNMGKENIILKSRQLGISSVTVALSIRACIVQPNTTCLLVSHDSKSTNTIFDKLKQQFNSLPDWLKPKLDANNRQELKFENGSKITCTTAGNKEIGRGDTLTGIIHLSEFAFWKNPEKQLHALSQAVSDTGKIIIESTARGYNCFATTYYKAKNDENSYKEFFFNWINGKGLFKNQYKVAMQEYKARNGRNLSMEDLDDTEIGLVNLGATLEQLAWRRKKISTDSVETFGVEYPATDEECFLTTGQQIFDSKRINSSLTAIITDKITPIPRDNIVGLPNLLRNYYGKSLSIWRLPQNKARYFLGVDCSEGLSQDSSTIIVLDADGEQVAQFKSNKIKPYEFADVVDTMGRYYNKGLITVEKASGGYSVIERLRYDKHYLNMTKYKTFDEFNRTVWRVGFDTNSKTKSIVVNDFREWFDKGLIHIVSKELLEEMKVFVANDNGSMGAMSGSHDDLTMATCLCIAGMKLGFYYPF